MPEKSLTYDQVVTIGAASLERDEYWVIDHDEGPLLDTKSKDFTVPVRLICEATGHNWDDLQDSGFRLGKITCPAA